ncbi:MAG: hypothetical protein ACTSRS_13845 [Candidatus Helarchaeota archaeon]
METHTKYIIAGGICCAEGGPFLLLGLLYGWLIHISQSIDPGMFPSSLSFWIVPFIIIGSISLAVGGTLLLIGLVKRNRAYRF